MAISDWPANPKAKLTISGAEPPLFDLAGQFQETLRDFALNVMRPIGVKLDKMTPQEAIAENSPFWDFRKQYLDLGITLEVLASMSPEEVSVLLPIVFEELGYGDAGLAISVAAGILPQYITAKFENQFLLERFPDTLLGCWGITEPDHGSDSLDASAQILHPHGNYGRPNCIATFRDDKVIINGQKSAWVSNGIIADVCILYCAADIGHGPDPHNGCVIVLPMDAPGVSRGQPLDKIGQRALNQGEIYFDNVELSLDYMLAGPEDYKRAVYCIHTEANALMGAIFAGVAQSALDHAVDYAHERKQGGLPIIRHQNVAYRLFHMARKVEAARALSRRVVLFNGTADLPALQAAMFAKVTSTQTSFEVASDAVQIFGGNGLTTEYPVEKIMRDARASMLEDGCNEVLAIKGGYYLMDPERIDIPAAPGAKAGD
ncbi:MAG: acyl-CoA dehydrogenase family protein [Halioglobus sp.]